MPAIDLSQRAFFRLTGPDARRYLNGQISQQIADLAEGEVRYTFICDLKGRVISDGFVRLLGTDDLLLDAPEEARELLAVRLERYLIADDCELKDESGSWFLCHQIGENGATGGIPVTRFGQDGFDFLKEGGPDGDLRDFLSRDEVEALRIRAKTPGYSDLTGVFPAETGELDRAVSFTKGCYQGQEVISRMRRAGKTNHQLAAVEVSSLAESLPAAFKPPASDKALFTLTSASPLAEEDGWFKALGYRSTKTEATDQLEGPGGEKLRFI